MHVQVVLYDGFDPLDVLGPYEIFFTGGEFSGGAVTVEFVSAEGPRVVPSGFPTITLTATAGLDAQRGGVIVVPGAAGGISLDPDVENSIGQLLTRAAATTLPSLLKEALHASATTVATVCGGSILVAQCGLADGRPLVTHERGADLAGTAAIPVDARVVDDGNLVSSGNVTSGIDMALHMLDREVGPQVAHAVGQLFQHERRGIVWRPIGSAVVTP